MRSSLLLLFLVSGFFIHAQAQTSPDTTQSAIGTHIPEPPQFPGGDSAFYVFIYQKIIHPNGNKDIQGTVFVSFYVETDGSLSDIKVVKGLEPSYDQAVVDAILKSPKWTPANVYGAPCRIKKIYRVTFEH